MLGLCQAEHVPCQSRSRVETNPTLMPAGLDEAHVGSNITVHNIVSNIVERGSRGDSYDYSNSSLTGPSSSLSQQHNDPQRTLNLLAISKFRNSRHAPFILSRARVVATLDHMCRMGVYFSFHVHIGTCDMYIFADNWQMLSLLLTKAFYAFYGMRQGLNQNCSVQSTSKYPIKT